MSDKEHKTKHKVVKAAKTNSTNVWMIATLALAVLLIISIVTGGFGLVKPTVSSLVSDINSLKSSTSDSNLKSALDSIATTLTPFEKAAATSSASNSGSTGTYTGNKVVITEYSDFQCPFCKSAEENAVAQIRKNFGDAITWNYREFPLSFHPLAQKAAEAAECAKDQGKFWEMHDKMFAVSPALEVDKLKQYAKDLGLDTSKFNTCLDSGAKASEVASQEAEGQGKGVSGTPAFFIDGQLISGAQPYESFLPYICKDIPNHPACLNAPKPTNFNIYVVEDKRCTNCDTTQISGVLSQIFTGAQIQKVDFNSTQGQELYNLAGVVYLPMYLLDSKAKDDPGFSKVQGALVQKGNYYVIQPQAVGSKFNPAKPYGTKNDKPVVELFVMSYCPFGTQAEKGILPAVRTLGDKIDFSVKFVDYSMHESFAPEVEENLRQYCIEKNQPAVYLKYLACFLNASNAQGLNTDTVACQQETGVDVAAMNKCYADTDAQYNITAMTKDKSTWSNGQYPQFNIQKDLNQKYGVQGSPTLIINGDESSAGRDSASYLKAICAAFNTPPAECNTQLSSTPPGSGFGYDSVGQATAAGCGV